ncbi:MAG: PqqD family protein [Candidatus Andersenbacteria bacterium]|nr:PqqD family protein [Candidatus Andersenbacteria bacterium]
MSDSAIYAVCKPSVVAEVIDGELVAIHLESGCYYHANRTGAVIWEYLEQGLSEQIIYSEIRRRYSIDEKRAERDVGAFIVRLVQEGLIRASNGDNAASAIMQQSAETDTDYEEPALKKHEDMRELLLLDPIHDVGEGSWPMQEVK